MKIAPVKNIVIIAMCLFYYDPTVLIKFFLFSIYLFDIFLNKFGHNEEVLGAKLYGLFSIFNVSNLLD